MGFLDKIRASFARFMSGRYGADQLSYAMVILALVMMVVGALSGLGLLTLMADALMIVMFVRMLSKDRYRRAHENQVYLEKTQNVRRAVTEWMNRVKNSKKYRYFTCPKCKSRLRVPRGVGSVTITCKSCGNKFDKKA
ncbi:MAG: hypothetical protein PUH70_12735 [Clostridiales bacterium]|nr:hypothetical protein [Clostridiales bacterium]MDY5348019.1 hypothetical protein [Candidatus Ventricola sp.]MDY5513376.1 hypothetical protein [Candidatus Ventricola sp.]